MLDYTVLYFTIQDHPEFMDRYTIGYTIVDSDDTGEMWTHWLTLSAEPSMPNEIAMYTEPPCREFLEEEDSYIDWDDLPKEVKAFFLVDAYGLTTTHARSIAGNLKMRRADEDYDTDYPIWICA